MAEPEASPLGPIDPSSVTNVDESSETEKRAPWIVRKLVGSMTGRIVMSSYESLRAAGTSVVCLSPWGDSSPIFLPCIRFRDLVVHAVIAGTGGVAAVAAPVMGPVSDAVIDTFGDSLLVEIGLHSGFEVTTKVVNDLVVDHTIKHIIPAPSARLETTGIKSLLVTLKYKHTIEDASLGFFRSSVHQDSSLFATVKDYLAIEKGWFNPYLFASGRRPIIPRSMKPDVVFCHGPFLGGDYKMGSLLLKESASAIFLCEAPVVQTEESQLHPPPTDSKSSPDNLLATPQLDDSLSSRLHLPSLSKYLPHTRSRTPSPEPQLAAIPTPPVPRRLVVLVLGIKPHRKLWSTSARPGESVINYFLLNGCPAIVVPAKLGAPLIAWDTLTLEKLHTLELPDAAGNGGETMKGVVRVLLEYLDLCIDWNRVTLETDEDVEKEEEGGPVGKSLLASLEDKKVSVKNALTLLLIAAVCSKDSKQVKKEVDLDRAGIVVFRIP